MQEINFTSTILKNNITTIALMAANRGEGNTTATVEFAFAMKTYSKGRVLAVDMNAMGNGLKNAPLTQLPSMGAATYVVTKFPTSASEVVKALGNAVDFAKSNGIEVPAEATSLL